MNMTHSFSPTAEPKNRKAWEWLVTAYDNARNISDQYNENVLDPMLDELERISPRPNLHFEIVAKSGQVGRFFVPANDLYTWDNHISPIFREKAAAVRDAWLVHVATCEQLGRDAICDESERLCELQCEAESDAIQTPAPDFNALLWKLDRMFGPEACGPGGCSPSWCPEWVNALMADAHRLLGGSTATSLVA